jgi:hypothetical protein
MFFLFKLKIKKIKLENKKIKINNKIEKFILFTCGDNNFHQKGIFTSNDDLLSPNEIKYFKNIKIDNIFTGINHTFIKNKGKCYLFFLFYNLIFLIFNLNKKNILYTLMKKIIFQFFDYY